MRQSRARQLLDGWEAFRGQPMPVRAAGLAAIASDVPLDDAMRWPVARRDRALFALRAQAFGNCVDAVARCPGCTELLEMQIDLESVRPPAAASSTGGWRTLRIGGRRVRCREPNSEDLLALVSAGDVDDLAGAREALLARCIEADDPEVRERAAARLPAEATDVRLRLACPACGHAWSVPFDIAAFVWRELEEWARRTLREIHVIAGAYGWTEEEILTLTASRRQQYVELIR